MSKRKPRIYDPTNLVNAIEEWNVPMYDKKHGYYIHLEERARSNQTRVQHIVRFGHDLKARDLKLVPKGISQYVAYKKDPIYKDTFNYYIMRKGLDKGFIKVSIQIDGRDSNYAWIKTVYVTYKIK